MDANFIPTIRLTIDSMRAEIVSALGIRKSELENVIEEQINRAIKEYPFESEIESTVNRVITNSIEFYFNEGNGSTIIRNAVTKVLDGIFKCES